MGSRPQVRCEVEVRPAAAKQASKAKAKTSAVSQGSSEAAASCWSHLGLDQFGTISESCVVQMVVDVVVASRDYVAAQWAAVALKSNQRRSNGFMISSFGWLMAQVSGSTRGGQCGVGGHSEEVQHPTLDQEAATEKARSRSTRTLAQKRYCDSIPRRRIITSKKKDK